MKCRAQLIFDPTCRYSQGFGFLGLTAVEDIEFYIANYAQHFRKEVSPTGFSVLTVRAHKKLQSKSIFMESKTYILLVDKIKSLPEKVGIVEMRLAIRKFNND